jgi:hypothetical protein
MAKLPSAYRPPKPPTAIDMKVGETWPFFDSSLRKDDKGDLFLPDDVEPLTFEKEAGLIQRSQRCVFIRRDPDGLVLILRPLNQGALKHLMPRLNDKDQRPIVRIEENPEAGSEEQQ